MLRTEGTYHYIQSPDNSQCFNRYSYCQNNPLRYTDPTGWQMIGGHRPNNPFNENWSKNYSCPAFEPRDFGLLQISDVNHDIIWMEANDMHGGSGGGSDYTVDRKGYVANMGGNNKTYDILYASDAYAAGDYSNGLIVYDLSILSGLTEDRADYSGNYGITTSKTDAFNVFYFMTENTDVEWGIDGYRISGDNEYVIRTSHKDGSVATLSTTQRNEMNCVFTMHSHCWPDGTKGASRLLIGNTWGACDMATVTEEYNRFERQGMTNINVWFKYQDTYTVFPKHYVYHKYSKNLYFYDVWVSDYFIRKINKANDLYRNLGF